MTATLGATSTVTTVDLGNLDSDRLRQWNRHHHRDCRRSIEPAAADRHRPGSVTIGSPVTATLTVNPGNQPTGSPTVTNTLAISGTLRCPTRSRSTGRCRPRHGHDGRLVLGRLARPGLCDWTTNGVDIVDVSNPASPVDDGTFGARLVVNGGFTVGRVDTIGGAQYLLVGTTATLNAGHFTLLIYSLANPLAPSLVSSTPFNEEFLSEMLVQGDTVICPHRLVLFSSAAFSKVKGVTCFRLTCSNPRRADAWKARSTPTPGPRKRADNAVRRHFRQQPDRLYRQFDQ